jgi:hypothetical protein
MEGELMQFSSPGSQGVHDFLISYAPADRVWGEWMGYVLEENGYSVFLAAWDIQAGHNVFAEIDSAIQQAKHILALMSQDYMQNERSIGEWTVALQDDPAGYKRRLIPINLRDVPQKGLISTRMPINLIDLDEEAMKQELLNGVRSGRAKPTKRPPFPGRTTANDTKKTILHFIEETPFPQNYEPITRPINVCILCADMEEDLGLLRQFLSSLTPLKQQGVIQTWHVNEIKAGAGVLEEIARQVEQADIILPLMSSDFFAGERFEEVNKLVQEWDRRRDGVVIPVLLRACDWQETPYARFRVLPEKGLAITSWGNRDEAFTDVIRGIRQVVNQLVMKKKG